MITIGVDTRYYRRLLAHHAAPWVALGWRIVAVEEARLYGRPVLAEWRGVGEPRVPA